MKHQTSRTLYSYWNEVRGNRIAPRRYEIEPARLAGILPEAFILERADPATYRFRLAGTKLCEHFGAEFRGVNFLDGWEDSDRLSLSRILTKVADKGAVGLLEMEACTESGRAVHFEAVIVPLSQTSTTIDRFLGTISTSHAPDWLGTEPLVERYLLRHEVIWPNGRQDLMAADMKPLVLPSVRDARLVRMDRRNFRVYEGGLSRLYQEKD